MFRPSDKVERGFVGSQSKVAKGKSRKIHGAGSESDLLNKFSHPFNDQIHKSKSEWLLVPHDEPRPSRSKRKKNRYQQNEPIYDTPSDNFFNRYFMANMSKS